ncbi:MAG TPA: hypothetical protein VD996_17080 [Chitinophagaceae bacterium]|nr:hypothetical protein [Chitinophagaceae bacterium]
MEEKQMTREESLALINRMISNARHQTTDNGLGWLIWGSMIFLASFASYLIEEFSLQASPWIGWNVFGLVAVPLMVFNILRARKKLKTRTYVDELLGLFDIGFAICIFVIIISLNVTPGSYKHGFGYFLMVYAFLMLIQGGAIRFRPLFIGAVVNWAGAIAIFYVNDFKYSMLITAIAVFVGYIIPGFMLQSQHRRRKKLRQAEAHGI